LGSQNESSYTPATKLEKLIQNGTLTTEMKLVYPGCEIDNCLRKTKHDTSCKYIQQKRAALDSNQQTKMQSFLNIKTNLDTTIATTTSTTIQNDSTTSSSIIQQHQNQPDNNTYNNSNLEVTLCVGCGGPLDGDFCAYCTYAHEPFPKLVPSTSSAPVLVADSFLDALLQNQQQPQQSTADNSSSCIKKLSSYAKRIFEHSIKPLLPDIIKGAPKVELQNWMVTAGSRVQSNVFSFPHPLLFDDKLAKEFEFSSESFIAIGGTITIWDWESFFFRSFPEKHETISLE
jgi:hypothetical protein